MHKSRRKDYKLKRKQWGAESRLYPLPTVHAKPSTIKIILSRLAIVITIVLWFAYILSTILRHLYDGTGNYEFTLQAVSYLIVVTFLTFSALMYLIMRAGALQRFSKHKRVPRAKLDDHFTNNQSSITVLVPSYAEEPDVIRKTLFSASLQEYPKKKIVLLIDDNPNPTDQETLAKLEETRQIGHNLMQILQKPKERFELALKEFEKQYSTKQSIPPEVINELAEHYIWASKGLIKLADNEKIQDHIDVFFKEQVFGELANELSLTAQALFASAKENTKLPTARVHQLYRRLLWIFNAEIEVFERKKYASLSHEANKAMNLNSYIGLMGGKYKTLDTPDGPILIPTKYKSDADFIAEDSKYILTLDADSILLRDYCLRLVYFLEQPGNENVAVTQTPYSSFRGAGTRIERLASATTDIQHILHQGMSHFNATFWVGANAVIRKKALEDIVETNWIGGFEIKRYIQDRTVIEDTESSIDLAQHGWTLINYPERLSYSATPPDFGSLVVQRRRWANGGLLILPKLWATVKDRKRRSEYISKTEVLIRLNYMASIAWSSFGLIFLLAYPYDSRLLSPIVVLSALPYFLAQASDLKYCGYKRSDIFRIYGFNLILLPVNLAGVLKSLQQSLSGKKIAFARTPKVKNRTASPMLYVIAPILIVAYSVLTFWRDYNAHNWGNAIFAGFNAIVTTWAILAYIGIWATISDTWLGLTNWMFVDIKPKKQSSQKTETQPVLDWQAILYHGHAQESVPLAARNQFNSSNQIVKRINIK